MSIFSERLKKLRGNESQTSFAKSLDITQATYSRYEQGKLEPNITTLCQISINFGVSVDWLLGLAEERKGSAITATHSAVANGERATATNGAAAAEIARLLGIIERQQALIEKMMMKE